jgi:hypothetical protein
MRVLAAVFANAGRIALDIPGIERRVVERRREQQRQAGIALHQLRFHGGHGLHAASRVGGVRDDAPGLRDRVDPAFGARGRAQRRTVIEVAAPVPIAVPCLAFERIAQRRGVRQPARRARALPARASQTARSSPAWHTGTIRARRSRPCPGRRRGSCRRSSRRCRSTAGRVRHSAGSDPVPRAMLEQRGRFVRNRRLEERLVLAGAQQLAFQKRHLLIQIPPSRRWSQCSVRVA